ncbi:MAG: hypothetical protein ACLFSU_05835 [Acholeplasmataceae bacterium]
MKECILRRKDRAKDPRVEAVAERVGQLLNLDEIKEGIRKVHRHGGSSTQGQAVLTEGLKEIGFQSERRGLFRQKQLRPDLYYEGEDFGILLEVERGKTLANNMDLLDLWKTHILKEADHYINVSTCYIFGY